MVEHCVFVCVNVIDLLTIFQFAFLIRVHLNFNILYTAYKLKYFKKVNV